MRINQYRTGSSSNNDRLSPSLLQRQRAEQGISATTTLTVSICGSYHRHLKEMKQRILECKKLGIKVLIPKYATPKSEAPGGFVILRGENGAPRELQEKNFRAISASSFIFVENPNGYIGPSTALEIGYAYARGVPIYCGVKPDEYIFTLFVTGYGKSVSEIKLSLLGEGGKNSAYPYSDGARRP